MAPAPVDSVIAAASDLVEAARAHGLEETENEGGGLIASVGLDSDVAGRSEAELEFAMVRVLAEGVDRVPGGGSLVEIEMPGSHFAVEAADLAHRCNVLTHTSDSTVMAPGGWPG